jgi:hypothetical protein
MAQTILGAVTTAATSDSNRRAAKLGSAYLSGKWANVPTKPSTI